MKLQAGGNENYVWVGSQPMTRNEGCRGCSELRAKVDDLLSRPMIMSSSVHQKDAGATYISERKQAEIDKMLLEARHRAETYQEAYEKVKEHYVLAA